MESFLQAVGAVISAALGLLSPRGKESHLRTSIRENLVLLHDLEASGFETPTNDTLRARIARDVNTLSSPKPGSQIKKSTVVVAFVAAVGFAVWTVLIVRNAHHAKHGVPWFGWLTFGLAIVGLLGLIGSLTPDQDEPTPPR